MSPIYDYQCGCGIRFEVRASLANRKDTKPCPHCSKQADPAPPAMIHGHFKKDVTGPVPQNTGIHDLDTKIDRVIGQSSHQGWEVAEGRRRMKQEIIDREGVTGHDISKNLDGSYRVLKPEERGVHERSQKIHQAARAAKAAKRSSNR